MCSVALELELAAPFKLPVRASASHSLSQLCYHRGKTPPSSFHSLGSHSTLVWQAKSAGVPFVCTAPYRAEVLCQERQAGKIETMAPTQHPVHKAGESF